MSSFSPPATPGTQISDQTIPCRDCGNCRCQAESDVGQDRLSNSAEALDEMTFGGEWTQAVLERAATHFDVPAQAVRRRMGGQLG